MGYRWDWIICESDLKLDKRGIGCIAGPDLKLGQSWDWSGAYSKADLILIKTEGDTCLELGLYLRRDKKSDILLDMTGTWKMINTGLGLTFNLASH